MRTLSLILSALAIGLAVFGYWGMNTPAGQHAWDEMAGIVPFSAGVASGGVGLIAALVWRRAARR